MTPLAQMITKELTQPISKRCQHDEADLLRKMDDIHCFDVTDVMDAVWPLVWKIVDGGGVGNLGFLPADKTWFEWRDEDGKREGFLLVREGPDACRIYQADQDRNGWQSQDYNQLISLSGSGEKTPVTLVKVPRDVELNEPNNPAINGEMDCAIVYAVLAIINSPRVVGRRQHMPHRGLEKKLIAKQKTIGKFPLHAWTEIKLQITPPKDMTQDGVYEAHLTGKKALHFCRAHLRVRNGKLEVVRGHWRGDAALGIKRSRYKLVA